MGVLTDDMTRLRDEVLASRGARAAILRDLARHEGPDEGGRRDDGLVPHVAGPDGQADPAECGTFLSGIEASVNTLRGTVAGLRRQFAADLRGAGKAWRGTARTAPKSARPCATRSKGRKG